MNILSLNNITKDFGGLKALDNVNLDVNRGEIVGLIGPNGSGKTTLINIISGFLPLTAGTVTYKKQTITGSPPHKLAELGISRTFQLTSVFPDLSVEENIMIGSHLKNKSGILGSIFQTKSYRQENIKLGEKVNRLINFWVWKINEKYRRNTFLLETRENLKSLFRWLLNPNFYW
jgi:branched-chain amino acid transport system ATP-binding protein